jgi:hypothetical protein
MIPVSGPLVKLADVPIQHPLQMDLTTKATLGIWMALLLYDG